MSTVLFFSVILFAESGSVNIYDIKPEPQAVVYNMSPRAKYDFSPEIPKIAEEKVVEETPQVQPQQPARAQQQYYYRQPAQQYYYNNRRKGLFQRWFGW